LPSYEQAHKLGFSLEKNGSAGVLDFVHKDKTTLSYVRLHSEQQPGRFALIDNYKLVFCGTVPSEAAFTALLLEHKWVDPEIPVPKPKKEKEANKEEKPRREPPHPTQWRPDALALLALMTPQGQQDALANWARISKEAGGPFTPALPATLFPAAPVALPTAPPAPGLLDDFTVLDFEFQDTHLLEVAAIRYVNWEPVDEFVSLVRYREPIRPIVTQVCGIDLNQVWNAPEEKWVLQKFLQLAEGSLLIAHNAMAADKRVLEAARRRYGKTEDLPNRWLCTQALAKQREREGLLPKDQKCGLGELCLHFNIDKRGHHQALSDVRMCYQVLRRFHEQCPITELITSLAKPKKPTQASLFPLAA